EAHGPASGFLQLGNSGQREQGLGCPMPDPHVAVALLHGTRCPVRDLRDALGLWYRHALAIRAERPRVERAAQAALVVYRAARGVGAMVRAVTIHRDDLAILGPPYDQIVIAQADPHGSPDLFRSRHRVPARRDPLVGRHAGLPD